VNVCYRTTMEYLPYILHIQCPAAEYCSGLTTMAGNLLTFLTFRAVNTRMKAKRFNVYEAQRFSLSRILCWFMQLLLIDCFFVRFEW